MNRLIKDWLSCWLYVISAIGGSMITALILNWATWQWTTKFIAFGVIILILHVLEEWRFPGGFYYMYNLQHKSDKLDRYPMNQITDMLTNFIPIMFGCYVVIFGGSIRLSLMWFYLSVMEVIVHTSIGFKIKNRFKNKGKKTIYNPGLITTLGGFLLLLVGFIIYFFTCSMPTISDFVWALIYTIGMSILCIPVAENIFKNENSKYPFNWGKGYFERYDE